MARLLIPLIVIPANDTPETNLGAEGVLLNDAAAKGGPDGDGYYVTNPGGRTALLCLLDVSAKSQGTLTITTIPTAGDTMTIGIFAAGQKVYTFRALADWNVNGEVLIGATLAASQQSIIDAINGDDGVNTAHTTVTADGRFSDDNKLIITAIAPGATGDTNATTETFTAGTNVFDAATLGTTTPGGVTGAATVKVIGVDDPYGRGASPDGDLTYTLTATVETKALLLGRYSPAMFNQSATPRTFNVDVTGVSGTGKLVAVSI